MMDFARLVNYYLSSEKVLSIIAPVVPDFHTEFMPNNWLDLILIKGGDSIE